VTAFGSGSLWVTPNEGGIQRVDPATGRVVATIHLPDAVAVTFWAGSAWISNQSGTIVRVDPASNRVVGTPTGAGSSPIYIAADPRGLWVVDFTAGELLHLAPAAAAR
jgi:DNA-binding beta-propeller fold protein YncE